MKLQLLQAMQDNILTFNFAEIEIPDFKTRRNSGYVRFGTKDDFPNQLIDLVDRSAKHNSIIENKCTYIFGGGLASDNEQDLTAQKFIAQNSVMVYKLIKDYEVFGGYYIKCMPKLNGGWAFEHLPFQDVRKNSDATIFYYQECWNGNSYNKTELPKFKESKKVNSVIEQKNYRVGRNIYGLPCYISAINYISADAEIGKHVLMNATSGFMPSKMISFFNGEPSDTVKGIIEDKFKAKFTGSGALKLMLSYNNESAKKPEIDDLGQSDLTKEDFSNIDNLICDNLFSGHQINNAQLFGVTSRAHTLGGNAGAEMRIAYNTFKNTYVNRVVDILTKDINFIAKINGVTSLISLVPTEPIDLQFSEDTILKFAPKSYILEKLGIDLTKYTDAPLLQDGATAPLAEDNNAQLQTNDNIKNLTAKQHQQVLRIIRQFGKNQITLATAKILLGSGLGLDEAQINDMLGVVSEGFGDVDFSEEMTAAIFEAHGENESEFEIYESKSFEFKEDLADDIKAIVVKILEENPKASIEDIATKSKVSKEAIKKLIGGISDGNGGSIISKLPNIQVRYKYSLRSVADGLPIKPTTRPFCKRLITANKLYSVQDIQTMSQILGYDVMRRSGGFWNNNGKVDIQCRHEFKSLIVVKK